MCRYTTVIFTSIVEKELLSIPREERNLFLFNGVYDESGMIAISTISDDFKKCIYKIW